MGPILFGITIISSILIIDAIVRIKDKIVLKDMFKNNWVRWTLFMIIVVHAVLLLEVISGVKTIYPLLDFWSYDLIFLTSVLLYLSQTESEYRKGYNIISIFLVFIALYGWLPYFRGQLGISITAGIGNSQMVGALFLIAMWFPTEYKNRHIELVVRVLFALTAFFSMQKSIWIGLILSLGMYFIFNVKEVFSKYSKVVLVLPVLCAGIALLIPAIRNAIYDRLRASMISLTYRLIPWKECVAYYWNEYSIIEKLFGRGYDIGEDLIEKLRLYNYDREAYVVSMDCQFITLLIEFGVIGIIALIIWFIVGFNQLKHKKESLRKCGAITVGMFSVCVFYDLLIKRVPTMFLVTVSAVFLGEKIKHFIKEKEQTQGGLSQSESI